MENEREMVTMTLPSIRDAINEVCMRRFGEPASEDLIRRIEKSIINDLCDPKPRWEFAMTCFDEPVVVTMADVDGELTEVIDITPNSAIVGVCFGLLNESRVFAGTFCEIYDAGVRLYGGPDGFFVDPLAVNTYRYLKNLAAN